MEEDGLGAFSPVGGSVDEEGWELLSNNSGFLVWLGVVLTQEEWVQRVGEDLTCNMLPLMAHCDFPYQGEHALFIKA